MSIPAEMIRPRPLHGEVADRLRDMILRGELAAGGRLNERLLAERFGISRTPLRDAIKLLSAEGLVQLLPNRGAFVTQITRAEAEEMFQVMSALEGLAGELACQHATDAEIAEIGALHKRMKLHYRQGELADYFALNQQIHQKIVECARNGELQKIHDRLSVRIKRVRYMANFSKERWRRAMLEHDQIMRALKARDAAQLGGLLKTHLSNKFDSVRESLQPE